MNRKWEYCHVDGGMGQVRIHFRDKQENIKGEIHPVLGKLGEQGWEAFACAPGDGYMIWALKREL